LIIFKIQNHAKLQMSLYSSSTSWGGNCSSTNQSPINLSQAAAKPCDLLCELVFDDVYVPQATVSISNEGMVLQNTGGLGSCKFNGQGYTCQALLLNHPSHHTIENIQADAEVIAMFTNPTGGNLCVSTLVRVNPHQTAASSFFNAFIPYGNPSVASTPVNLGENWGLFQMVPPNGAYYVYDGSLVTPGCDPTKWVVFKSMINIDSNDFALLVKNVNPGSRPIQGLSDREIFYNDVEQLPGGPMPHDNKTYMKCRRSGQKTPLSKPVKQAELGTESAKKKKGALDHVHDFVSNQVSANGYIGVFTDAAMILATIVGIVFAVMAFNSMDQALVLNGVAQSFAAYVKSWVSWLYQYIFKFFGSVSQQIKDRANKQALAIPKPTNTGLVPA
jgi:carbonic anhydrase